MSKPVIFIPGYPGTELRTRQGKKIFVKLSSFLPTPDEATLLRLEGPDDLSIDDGIVAGEPIPKLFRFLIIDLAKQAASLYEILKKLGVDPVKFGWDWRRPIWDEGTQDRLEAEVRLLRQSHGQKVVAIVHSTGGLVLRRLLEKKPSLVGQFERVIAFGVPWAGLLKSLQFLDGQERLFTVGKPRVQKLIANSWAAYDILPPDPAKTDMLDAAGNPLNLIIDGNGHQTSPLVKRGWFRSDLVADMTPRARAADRELGDREASLELGGRRLPITNIVGWGAETPVQAKISGSGSSQRISDWKKVTDGGALDGGDGTVPFRSASWLRGNQVTRFHVPVGFHSGAKRFPHSSLWRNPGGRNLLRHLLAGESLKPFVYAAVDTTDFKNRNRVNVRVRLSTLDANGQPLTGVRVRATDLTPGSPVDKILAPGDGRHKITIRRDRMRRVHLNRFRRFTLRITWNGGRVNRVLLVSEVAG